MNTNVYELTSDTRLIEETDFIFAEFLNVVEEFAPHIKSDLESLQDLVTKQDNDTVFTLDKFDVNLKNLNSLIRSISLYLMLLNILEERRDVRNIKSVFHDSISFLEKQGYKHEAIVEVLKSLQIYPVFTAHPTESRRRVLLEAHKKISQNIEDVLLSNDNDALDDLRYRLRLVWQSNFIRKEKTKVLAELDNLLVPIEDTMLDSLSELLEEVEEVVGEKLDHSPIRIGSWIGGDRDGNPFVTNEVMTTVMKIQHEHIIKRYIKDIDGLFKDLSVSSDIVKFDSSFLESIDKDLKHIDLEAQKSYAYEPIRLKLLIMKKKLENRLINIHSSSNIDFTYKEIGEFIDDIDLILGSMDDFILKDVKKLRNLAVVAGFHLAKLDFREHKNAFYIAITEILSVLGLADSDFSTLMKSEQTEILNKAFEEKYTLERIQENLSPLANDIINVFRKIAWAKDNISKDIIDSFILSMSTSSVDLLIVLWFAKQSNLWVEGEKCVISITPLFETIEDLQQSTKIITQLVNNKYYRAYLKDRKNTQEVMIGYSDSSKDGGIFASSFNLQKAITRLMSLGEELGVKFLLFHGRGGSMSRGGGSTHDAIMSSVHGSVNSFFKVTEQGEQISSKYLNKDLAKHNFKQTLSATLKRSIYDSFENQDQQNYELMNVLGEVSDISMKSYKNLVYGDDGFITYFNQATPLEFIGQLNIGSRPSKRNTNNSIEDLRAIPWVFSWTQNRSIICAWYGLGSGLEAIAKKQGGEEKLKECYNKLPFFKTFIDNVAMALLKTNLEIAKLYNEFVEDKKIRNRIWENIEAELKRTVKYILILRDEENLLEKEVALRQSILLKKPFLNLLNILQIELIKSYKKAKNKEEKDLLAQKIGATIIGIAQGMRNTG